VCETITVEFLAKKRMEWRAGGGGGEKLKLCRGHAVACLVG
jgi:hypothetical protein